MAPKPVIGLTADIEGFESPKRKGKERFFLKEAYFNAIFLAGGVPLLIPAYSQSVRSSAYFQMIDGLVVTGGYFDIDPRLYGERPEFRIDELKPERTKLEIYLIKKARKAGIPQLGVCGGMQAMNVAFGGSLYQDIPSQLHSAIKHEQKPSPVTKPTHKVNIVEKTLLARVIKSGAIRVNSTHHQGVKVVGKGLKACAISPDGLVEGIEFPHGPMFLGVQWHPEQLAANDQPNMLIFKRLVAEARKYRKQRAPVGR